MLLRRVVRQTLGVLAKDAILEWRGRSRFLAVLLFGVVTLLLFSFAVGPDTTMLRAGSGGFLVLALLLSSTLGLQESFRLEQEHRAMEGLLLLPVEPVAIFLGKLIGNALFLFLLLPILAPIALVLYAHEVEGGKVAAMAGLWFLAALGLAAPGTLYSAMTSRLRGRDVLLPLLLFPVVMPILMAVVKAMGLVLEGDPMGQLGSWTLLLTVFDAVFLVLCPVLAPFVFEED
jgi:heme exporter protein B